MTMQSDRFFRELCPEADKRDAMDDGEFWDYVLLGIEPGPERPAEPEIEEPVHADWCATEFHERWECDCGGNGGACPVCGALGPCGFDNEGVPMIHTTPKDVTE